MPGQASACNTVACPGGAIPTATCDPAGVLGPCVCPTTGAAGTGMVVAGAPALAAGSGSPPIATAGTGAAGVTAGVAGGPGPAAGGGAVAGGPAVTPTAGTTGGVAPGTWPQMGFDQNNNYHNPHETKLTVENAPMLKEKWRFTIAGYPPGTPVIGEGKVFVMANGGSYAINLADGTKAWERLDLPGTASLAYDNGFVYVHTYEGPNLYKIKASDGTTVWGPMQTNPTPMCDGMSSPILGGGMVVVGHSCGAIEIGGGDVTLARGGAAAFDMETGMMKWRYYTVPPTGEDGAMIWSSVGIDVEGKVVFGATGNNYSQLGANSDAIHAIDMMTGQLKWKKQVHTNDVWSLVFAPTGPDTDFGANPILAVIDGKKVVANGDKGSNFYMFDRETGNIIWQRDKLSSSRNAQNGGILMNGAFDGTYFYVVANQPPNASVLHALDPTKMGADAWPPKTFMKTTWGAPSVANGVLVVPNDDDLYVYNAKTGEQLNKFATGGTIAAGSATIVDGNVVVQSGLTYTLDRTVKNNNQIICYGLP